MNCRRVLGWMERKVQEWVEEEWRVEGWIEKESRGEGVDGEEDVGT